MDTNNNTTNTTSTTSSPFWGGAIRTIEKGIVPVLHIVTAALAAVALHTTITWASGWVAVVIAIAMSFLIERLIAKILPPTIAAAIRGYFRDGMFWAMAFVSLLLLIVNPFLSWKGGQQATDGLVPSFQYTNTGKVDSLQAAEQAKAGKRYATAIETLQAQQEALAGSIRAKYAAKIAAQERIISQRRGMIAKGHKWAVDKIGPAQAEISRLESRRDAEISEAVAALSDKIAAQQLQATRMDSVIAAQYSARRETIQAGDALNRDRWERKYLTVAGVMFLFGVGFEFLLLICAFLVEYHFRHDNDRYNSLYTGKETSKLARLVAKAGTTIVGPLYEFAMLRLDRVKLFLDGRAKAIHAHREATKKLAEAKGEFHVRIKEAATAKQILKLQQELEEHLSELPNEIKAGHALPQIVFEKGKFSPGQTVDLDPYTSAAYTNTAPADPATHPTIEPKTHTIHAPHAPHAPLMPGPAQTFSSEVLEEDLSRLAMCARKHFARQFTSADPAARARNAEKYKAEKARLLAAGASIEEQDRSVYISLPVVKNS